MIGVPAYKKNLLPFSPSWPDNTRGFTKCNVSPSQPSWPDTTRGFTKCNVSPSHPHDQEPGGGCVLGCGQAAQLDPGHAGEAQEVRVGDFVSAGNHHTLGHLIFETGKLASWQNKRLEDDQIKTTLFEWNNCPWLYVFYSQTSFCSFRTHQWVSWV